MLKLCFAILKLFGAILEVMFEHTLGNFEATLDYFCIMLILLLSICLGSFVLF